MITVHVVEGSKDSATRFRLNPKKIVYYKYAEASRLTLIKLITGDTLMCIESVSDIDSKIDNFFNKNKIELLHD